MSIRLINPNQTFINPLPKAKRWVIKVGSSTVNSHFFADRHQAYDTQAADSQAQAQPTPFFNSGLNQAFIQQLVMQLAYLHEQNIEVILVTSGAIAQGMVQLGWKKRPQNTAQLQAAAAVGQMGLMQAYQNIFNQYQILCAQILLTHDDLSHRERYLNARATLQNLLANHVVPIINENDTVITSEIKFGDNDTLAALVANLIDADVMILLTDQEGIYTDNPSKNPDAVLIEVADAMHPKLIEVAGNTNSEIGTGGMASKVFAAKRAAKSGIHTVIAHGKHPDVLKHLQQGKMCGSLLLGSDNKLSARKQWIMDHLQIGGSVTIDDGAFIALQQGRSLLPIGLKEVRGRFNRGDVIACLHEDVEVARGISQYSSVEAKMIAKKSSDEIIHTLGYVYTDEMIHRNDLVLLEEQGALL